MPIGLKGNADGSGAIQVGGTDAVTLSTALDTTLVGSLSAPNTFAFKNRIINGAMVIDQRNNGASVAPVNAYTLDRWRADSSTTSKYTVQRNAGSVTPPAGFSNYLGVTSTSAYSITSGDYFALAQNIEGYNIVDLAWGTASAATVTLSFWVRSSLTGTFGGSLYGGQVYPFTYTISAANTWEQKFITITGSTSGTWNNTNGIGINVNFGLGVGSTYSAAAGAWTSGFYYSATGATSVVGTNGATFYITGVQLEKGRVATSFDVRPYTTELQLCQRYLPAWSSASSVDMVATISVINSTTGFAYFTPIVQPRVAPTGVTATATELTVRPAGGSNTVCTAVSYSTASQYLFLLNITVASGLTANAAGHAYLNASGAKILWNGCEL